MLLQEGDIAFQESVEEWKIIFEVPLEEEFFIIVDAIMSEDSCISVLLDNKIVSQAYSGDSPGWRRMGAKVFIRNLKSGTEVTAEAKLKGMWKGKPYILATTIPPVLSI